jgi:hypothetical protein
VIPDQSTQAASCIHRQVVDHSLWPHGRVGCPDKSLHGGHRRHAGCGKDDRFAGRVGKHYIEDDTSQLDDVLSIKRPSSVPDGCGLLDPLTPRRSPDLSSSEPPSNAKMTHIAAE